MRQAIGCQDRLCQSDAVWLFSLIHSVTVIRSLCWILIQTYVAQSIWNDRLGANNSMYCWGRQRGLGNCAPWSAAVVGALPSFKFTSFKFSPRESLWWCSAVGRSIISQSSELADSFVTDVPEDGSSWGVTDTRVIQHCHVQRGQVLTQASLSGVGRIWEGKESHHWWHVPNTPSPVGRDGLTHSSVRWVLEFGLCIGLKSFYGGYGVARTVLAWMCWVVNTLASAFKFSHGKRI